MADIPIVDYKHAMHGTEEEKMKIAKQIDEAFRKKGFVYLLNHGVSTELVQDCFAWVCMSFFQLSLSCAHLYHPIPPTPPPPPPHRI